MPLDFSVPFRSHFGVIGPRTLAFCTYTVRYTQTMRENSLSNITAEVLCVPVKLVLTRASTQLKSAQEHRITLTAFAMTGPVGLLNSSRRKPAQEPDKTLRQRPKTSGPGWTKTMFVVIRRASANVRTIRHPGHPGRVASLNAVLEVWLGLRVGSLAVADYFRA